MYQEPSHLTAAQTTPALTPADSPATSDSAALHRQQKQQKLKEILQSMGRVMIAFSGGTDSTFLLYSAAAILTNKNVSAVTADTPLQITQEIDFTRKFTEQLQISQFMVTSYTQLSDPLFCSNQTDRCYHCKKNLFRRFADLAQKQHYQWLVDGTNRDDLNVYRPGIRAAQELGVRHPLQEAGLTKQDIRILSQQFKLPTWNRPSSACLASRFPYGETITAKKVTSVRQAEQYLTELGFLQNRVRYHQNLARIEVLEAEIARLLEPELRQKVTARLKALGFTYITIDIQGFRSGSLDEIKK